MRRHLWTATTNGPIVHSQFDIYIWAWRTMVEWYRQVKTTVSSTRGILWHSYGQSHPLAKQEDLGEINGEFGFQISFVYTWKVIFTCHKYLRHWADGFTSHRKESVLRIFIARKNLSPRPGMNLRTLGQMASTLNITPLVRLYWCIVVTHGSLVTYVSSACSNFHSLGSRVTDLICVLKCLLYLFVPSMFNEVLLLEILHCSF
jgi:hypothetical protein